ncbi:MAG: hypothetical protein QMD92_00680 [bacterium]|nr:hypothetical protein [bacterium]
MNKSITTIIFIGIIYSILSFFILPKQVFFSGDNASKFIQIQNLIKHNWKKLHIEYPGEYLDQEHNHFPIRVPTFYEKNHKFYFIFPLSFSFLSSFFYYFMGFSGLYLLPLISSTLTIYLIFKFFQLSNKIDSLFLIVVAGLCSPIFFYGVVFWEHSVAMLLSFWAFFLFFKSQERDSLRIFISGLIFGISIWFRLEVLFFFIATILSYFLFDNSNYNKKILNLIIISSGFAFSIFPLLYFNYTVFGNFTGAHASVNFSLLYEGKSILYFVNTKIKETYHLLFDSGVSRNVNLTFLFLSFVLFFLNIISKLRKFNKIIIGILALTLLYSIYIASLCYFSRIIGLLVTSPFILIIFLDISNLIKKQRYHRINLLFFTSLFYLLFLLTPPGFGDKQWGPRFLLCIYPLLIILSFHAYYNLKYLNFNPKYINFVKSIFILFCIISFSIQCIGIYKTFHDKNITFKEITALKNLNSQIIITDVWWLPQEAASIFYKKCFFWIRSSQHLHNLLSNFKKKGVDNFIFTTSLAPTSKENIARTLDFNYYKIIRKYGYFRNKAVFISDKFENSLFIYKN